MNLRINEVTIPPAAHSVPAAVHSVTMEKKELETSFFQKRKGSQGPGGGTPSGAQLTGNFFCRWKTHKRNLSVLRLVGLLEESYCFSMCSQMQCLPEVSPCAVPVWKRSPSRSVSLGGGRVWQMCAK